MKNKIFHLASLRAGLIDTHFGVDPESETAGKLRAEQVSALAKTGPMMLVAMVLISTFTTFVFYNHPAAWFLPYWLAGMFTFSVLGIYQAILNRKRGKIKSASSKVYFKAVKVAVFCSFMWSAMAIMLYPHVSDSGRIILVAVISGMLGGGAMSLYAMPSALLTWVGLLTLGGSAALLTVPGMESFIILAMLLLYAATLSVTGFMMSKNFTKSIINSFELAKQAETIGLLLKDFSENASDWLWELDKDGNLVRGEEEFRQKLKFNFGFTNINNIPDTPMVRDGQLMNTRELKQLRSVIQKAENFRDLVVSSKGKHGKAWVSLSGKPLHDAKGNLIGYRGVASDVTEAKKAEERIAYLAHNDALTGLVNRENFSLELETLLKKKDGARWSIFYLDLDRFKSINDTYGHLVGDKLLGEVATLLKNIVPDNDLVARLGGDQFAILSLSAPTVQSASAMAETILGAFKEPLILDGIVLDVGVSIGITLSHQDGNDINTLMYNADLALYRAKADGRRRFCMYQHEMDEIIKDRRSLEVDLKNALRYGQLSLSFQPLVSSKTGKTVSFEALARWHHPERGAISPADFIPIAERMGIIAEIGDWVINRACEVATEFPEHMSIAVNLSPQQFKSNRIISTVVNALTRSGLSPKRLELEITEGLFMENSENVMMALRELKSMGVSVALDDFGTGYSSLSYLLKFPFDKLKIDRSLIKAIDNDDNATNVLEAITKLAAVMDLKVTAEGVETQSQVNVLRKLNCDQFQGFMFGRPLTYDQMPIHLLNELEAVDNVTELKAIS